ncbi:MAG: hypothetical protein ACFCUE_05060 [Candidatus Bathyarchaeia archaeon]
MPALPETVISFVAALVFALISLYTFKLLHYTEHHKRRFLSFFGGVAAAYVFLDLLPSLEQAGIYLTQISVGSELVMLYEDAIFFVVFVGFLLFFVLEHVAKRSRIKKQALTKQGYNQTVADRRVFIVHFINYGFMTLVLSYLLIFEFQASITAGLLFTFAVSLHLFIATDSMIEHYKHYQLTIGRYVGAAIPLVGWAISMLFPEHLAEVYVLLALISGTILYTSIKNEIPSESRKQSLAFFLVGSAFYAVLLLAHAIIAA